MPHRHSTIRDGNRLVWYTDRLHRLAADLQPFVIQVQQISELDQNCWFGEEPATLREMIGHFARIQAADLTHPIILNDDGSLMDGGHRLCRAILEGHETMQAVQFPTMPEPDEILELEIPRR
ncbi:MAG: hypothetical protein ACR2NP_10265 [Pirellulaceae bacterium]